MSAKGAMQCNEMRVSKWDPMRLSREDARNRHTTRQKECKDSSSVRRSCIGLLKMRCRARGPTLWHAADAGTKGGWRVDKD